MTDPRETMYATTAEEVRQREALVGWHIDTWAALEGRHKGARAIVVGNGPSRGYLPNRGLDTIQQFRDKDAVVIGSNAQWDEPFCGLIDYFVCYDIGQIHEAIKNTDKVILAPAHRVYRPPAVQPTPTKLSLKTQEQEKRRLYSIDPHVPRLDRQRNEPWRGPLDAAIGNFSGILAYQLAWVMGCTEIVLVGMDCAIEPIGETGKRTCIDEAKPGYENSLAYKLTACFDSGNGVLVPRTWKDVRESWRFLTDQARHAGVRTVRGHDHGSLTWVPVASSAK